MYLNKKMYKDFLEECEKGKKLSQHTLKACRIDLQQFVEYQKEKYINRQEITQYM